MFKTRQFRPRTRRLKFNATNMAEYCSRWFTKNVLKIGKKTFVWWQVTYFTQYQEEKNVGLQIFSIVCVISKCFSR